MEATSKHPPKFGLLILLLAFVVLLVIYPFLSLYDTSSLIIHSTFTILFTACLYLMVYQRAIFIVGVCIYFPAIVFKWLRVVYPQAQFFFAMNYLLSLLFVALAIICIQLIVFHIKKFTFEVGVGAVTTYLLLGVFFFEIYSMIEYFQPGAFKGAHFFNKEEELLYYSYVTLTTLGYGEIIASAISAKFISVVEAVMGQMFIATVVARAVARYIKQDRL